MFWTQSYSPAGSVPLSALIAAAPVVVLLALLGVFHVRAHVAALAGLITSLLIATFAFHMPQKLAWTAAGYGCMYGLFPIGWIVLCAIFVYDITVQTGQFEIVKQSIAGLADDRRIQALLIAFSFGAFIEGAAGFGTPVAISGAMLIGLGFKPRSAAGLALIGNTAPVAFGGLGIPLVALAKVTNLPVGELGMMVGRQLPVFSLLIPFWLIAAMCGIRRMREVWPACLTAGLSFAVMQFLVSNYYGPSLVDIIASATSILAMLVLLKFWRPKQLWRFDHDEPLVPAAPRADYDVPAVLDDVAAVHAKPRASARMPLLSRPTPRQALVAWMPWVILSLVVFAWGVPPVKAALNRLSSPAITLAALDHHVYRAPPVVPKAYPEEAVFSFNWLSATGTALLFSAIISGLLLGVGPAKLLELFGRTLWRVRISLITIAAMLALGFVTRFGGLDATMGLAFAGTGKLFPFFSPLLGWLGVALTGSDTSSNVLFGNLQQITASRLGISPVLAAAANSSGGVMGKMIDAQSIVVAGVATGQEGNEGTILRDVFFHSLALAILVGLLVLAQAYVFPGIVP
jgi:lactate permease